MHNIENDSVAKLNEQSRRNLLIMNYCLLASHVVCLAYFTVRQIHEMAIINIFSVCWFVLQALLIIFFKPVYRQAAPVSRQEPGRRKPFRLSYTMVGVNMLLELILHQIMAVIYLGWDVGFQYVLLGLAVPFTVFFNDNKFRKVNVLKIVISLGTYLILFLLNATGSYQPKYVLENQNEVIIVNCILFCTTFVMISLLVLSSYERLEKSVLTHASVLKEENEKFIKMQRHIIDSVAGIIESRDVDTGQHTERTTLYVEAVANVLKEQEEFKDILTEKNIQNMSAATALHDIGKIATPDAILNKPGKLTEEEYDIIKEHSNKGGQIIQKTLHSIEDVDFVNTAYQIAKYHHERWDGKGYPEGLKGEEIPLVARIVAVADVYDALVSKRCYKDAFEEAKALAIIKSESGHQFDPLVVGAFLKVKEAQT